MSEGFYNHLLGFFLGMVVLFFSSSVTAESLTLFFLTGNSYFLTGFSLAFLATLFYGMRYLLKFREFKGDMYLYFPVTNEKIINPEETPENIINSSGQDCNFPENLPFEVCRLYANDASLCEIQHQLGIKHPQQVKRLLIKRHAEPH